MKKPMKKLMNKPDALVLVAAPPPVVLAAAPVIAPMVPADPEVAATAKRRQFSGSERRRILTAADRCTAPGEISALLRREGLYSSQLAAWRKKRVAQGRTGPDSQQSRLRSFEGIVPKSIPWQTLGTDPAQAGPAPSQQSVTL